MLTELEHGYSMLACATPQRPPLSADFDRISSVFFFFFSYSLFSLHSTAARLPQTVSICVCGADWKEGPPTSSYDFDG